MFLISQAIQPTSPLQVSVMSLFPHVTQVFLDKIFSLLVPLFLTAAGGNQEAARHAVERGMRRL